MTTKTKRKKKKTKSVNVKENTATSPLPATPRYTSKESKEDFSNERINLLKDPNLFKNIVETELNKKIVGEVEARKVIVLCAYGGRLVENCQTASYNLMVNDDAGTGKDYVTGASLELMPSQFYIKKTRLSPTVLNYWHNSKDDPLWTWDGKVLYLEDISENLLNHEVFKVMCSSGSSATVLKDQKVLELEIKGKPVVIITTATATPNPELTRRFAFLNLDNSQEQTKAIMKRHSHFRKNGIMPILNIKLKEAMQFLKPVKVKIPFTDYIDQHFPSENIIMRTNYPRFLDFISASTALHQFQRKTDEDGFLLAEGFDYDLARECFLKVCSNKFMIPLTINQKKILEVFRSKELKGNLTVLHTSMNFLSDRALSYNLNVLTSYKILESYYELNQYNKEIECFRLNNEFKTKEKVSLKTYDEIMNEECRNASSPSTPSGASSPSIPSSPNKKTNNNDIFLEEAKEPKEPKVVSGEENLQLIKKTQEEFS